MLSETTWITVGVGSTMAVVPGFVCCRVKERLKAADVDDVVAGRSESWVVPRINVSERVGSVDISEETSVEELAIVGGE